MVSFRTYSFSVLLLHVLAAVVTSSAAVTDGVARSRLALEQQDLKYRQTDEHTYEMVINEDEERRIVELLGPNYLDVGLVATRVTGPPRHCHVCGKPTEFVDWVFTALARGIHSPEFIVESLKLGNSPKKLGHDVYCSQCGHLTNFRDATGEEGGAPYLGLATPYDRTTRTFAENVYKRDLTDRLAKRDATVETDSSAVKGIYWHYPWDKKRDEDAVDSPALIWDPLWSRKRDENAVASPAIGWHPLWDRKRDETDRGPAATWGNVWVLKHTDNAPESASLLWGSRWILKRDEDAPNSDSVATWGGAGRWIAKRGEDTPESASFWGTRWVAKRGEDTPESIATWGGAGRWIAKRGEDGVDSKGVSDV